MIMDFSYFLFLAPAILLALWAQMRVRSTYAQASQEPARMTGAQAARRILDDAGLNDIAIEEVPGQLTDHYDPSARVVRLSEGVYRTPSLAAVGIAAHEVGHAIQHATHYAPLVLRSAAVPAATWGPNLSMILLMAGFIMQMPALLWLGILAYSGIVIFQLINLPVEFDASNRAKRILAEMGIVSPQEGRSVSSVLNAAAWTYVAGTLQSVLTLVYYLSIVAGSNSRDER